MIQFTAVSKTDHKGDVNQLSDICSHLKEKNPSLHKLVFVIPKENIKSSQYQENLSDISQYVIAMDTSPSINFSEMRNGYFKMIG